MDIFRIKSLQSHILFDVLIKLPNVPLCRLRQTCQFMDRFVEENKTKLASRDTDQLTISISSVDESPLLQVTIGLCDESTPGKTFPLENFDFEKNLSGITVNKFEFHLYDPFAQDYDFDLLKIAALMPPCNEISLSNLKIGTTLKVIEITNAEVFYVLNSIQGDIEDFGGTSPRDGINSILEKMGQDPKKRSFYFEDMPVVESDGLFDRIKQFFAFKLDMPDIDLYSFLWDIFHTTDPGKIFEISITFNPIVWPAYFTIEGVTFATLWQLPPNDEGVQKLRAANSDLWIGSLNMDICIWTESIRVASVVGKFLLVLERSFPSSDDKSLNIFFMETSAEVWLFTLEQMQLFIEDVPGGDRRRQAKNCSRTIQTEAAFSSGR